MTDIRGAAIVLSNGWLDNIHAKTTHGLLRGTSRFQINALIDSRFVGKDPGEILDGVRRNIPIFATVDESLTALNPKPQYCIVGVAVHGGLIPETLRDSVVSAMRGGMSIVCGLHSLLQDDPEFSRVAAECGVRLIDVRKPKSANELRFWSGEIFNVKTPRIAVLGTDCALGKRTTAKMLTDLCSANDIKSEMIYTGQTGWMQGYKHGFIFDSTINDFITGEIERVIVECERESSPDVMFIEGQSSLRNPSGPCGSEFLKAGDVKGVILQHAPARTHFDGLEDRRQGLLPTVESEIELIRFYGSETLSIALNEEKWDDSQMRAYQKDLSKRIGIPVIRPLKDGLEVLLPVIREFIKEQQKC